MKNKSIYFIAGLLALFTCFSCNKSDNDPSLEGNWHYSVSHLVFDYTDANIQLPGTLTLEDLIPLPPEASLIGLNKLNKIPVDALTKMAYGQLHGQLMTYFKGIEFISDTQLNLLMKVEGEVRSFPATYTVQKDIIRITVAPNTINLGGIVIPENINLNYIQKKSELIVYLTKETIQKFLTPEILAIIPPIEGLTAEEMQAFVQEVMNKTRRLEVGAVLTPAK